MAHGERVGPEGLSRHSEDVGVQTSLLFPSNLPNAVFSNDVYVPNTSRDDYLHSSNDIHPTTSMEELYRSMSQTSINDNSQYREDIEINNQEILTTSRDVPVCLHQGTQGGSPVLITLPFQSMDNLQTFVPCSTCHQPNTTSPSIRASNVVAFCVSEVNIRTSQLTLVPCFLCWKPAYQSLNNVPNKISVPLFPTLSTNSDESGTNEESIRFVPCGVCLQEDHDILAYPNSTQTQQTYNQPPLEPEVEENHYLEQSDNSLSDTRTYFKPLRVSGTTESVREFMTQTSPILCDEVVEEQDDENGDLPVAWFVPFSNRKKVTEAEQPLSLQRAFLKHCTKVVKNSKQRQRNIPELAQLRLKTVKTAAKSKEEKKIHSSNKYLYNFGSCPPFTHKEMRKQTERIYRRLPEAYEPQRQKLKAELNQTHRLMAYLFQKKLQRATLKGKVSWEITESCL